MSPPEAGAPLLSAEGLSFAYDGARRVAAVTDLSLDIYPGETLGLVGASGSGKSTLARLLTRLVSPSAGQIRFLGRDWLSLRGMELRRARRHMQMVFQDPLAAFNPRATVAGALTLPLRLHDILPPAERPAEVIRLLERVGIAGELAGRSILDLSGGQRQRVAIARALASRPRLVILDEAVSALDTSVRGRILRLLADLQREEGLAYLFISHDLAAVRALSHRIAVLDKGRIVESGPAGLLVARPASDALRALVAAVPRLDR